MPRKKAGVLIVDPHPAMCVGLRQLLSKETDLEVLAEATGPQEAAALLRQSPFDLVLIELFRPAGEGLALISTLKEARPEAHFLVFSDLDESIYAERALRAGASGFVAKKASTADLLGAIRSILRGRPSFSPEVVQILFSRLASNDAPLGQSPIAALTDRELGVFELLGRGCETREIAHRLGISPKTVSTYYDHLKTKLNLPTKSGLIRRAVLWLSEGKSS